ncbi:transaldolase [Halomonas sp. MCCC 1A11036]|uniref:Transaldolase n=1 Tax=Billgrantia zhangzhouensis TaxID=2733481 RepID=A0ABS9AEH0_9GAMM|nr:transaldolase [Halomonas zhangzhouensis]MCE8020116.1 transaldolase [Halomonas zhangzhouensis]
MPQDKLSQLKAMTTVVADTGDLEAIRRFQPTDATTNPSLILQAAQHEGRRERLAEIARQATDIDDALDAVAVEIGSEISGLVPGYVSTEVSARLSFDTEATLVRARSLIERYDRHGIGPERILIKIASTWEGIRAARQLEREGIHCNLTLLFSFAQAQACADAGVTLVSPFVGRILDWNRAKWPDADFSGDNDPGVKSVKRIYEHYKGHGYKTIVMGASFRNTGEILALAGCDRLTISPALLSELAESQDRLERRLTPVDAETSPPEPQDEAEFRWAMNEDAMATEKLAEGIRKFADDQRKLEKLLGELRQG